jgi:hypothetical protein
MALANAVSNKEDGPVTRLSIYRSRWFDGLDELC